MRETGFRTGRVRRRPPYDHLTIYGFVEAGIRRTGLSVNAFCDRYSLQIVRGGALNDGPYYDAPKRFKIISKATLRRRYVDAKRRVASDRNVLADCYPLEDENDCYEAQLEALIRQYDEMLDGSN